MPEPCPTTNNWTFPGIAMLGLVLPRNVVSFSMLIPSSAELSLTTIPTTAPCAGHGGTEE